MWYSRRISPRAIDFGLCGYGFYLHDLAAALLELSTEQRRSLIRGYSSVRALEPDYERKLECFFVKIMIGNYSHHISNPDELPACAKNSLMRWPILESIWQTPGFCSRGLNLW
ncbi:hypothetical protein ACFSQ7_34970 [Paenibacillus rhizoplanae]